MGRLRGGHLAVASIVTAVALLAGAPAASAGPQPSMVVWSGGLVPGAALHGVQIKANGTGTRLTVRAADRATGKVTTVGSFSPSPAQLAAIRTAAKAAFAAPGVQASGAKSTGLHGGYASAVIRVGSQTRTVLGVNAASPRLRALLVAINAALPEPDRLDDPSTGMAQAAAGPPTTNCPPGQTPTTISRRIGLDEAAALGAVSLKAKGGYGGDSVAVDATWKATNKPVTVKINIEVSSYPGGPGAADVEQAIEARLGSRVAADGTKVNFDVVGYDRGEGGFAAPCFHQVRLLPDADFRGYAGESASDALTTPQSGEWPSGRGPVRDRQIWTHEALHLAGLDDQYSSFFKVGNKLYPIPDEIDIEDKKQLADWAKSQGLDPKAGVAGTKAKPGHAQDIMGDVFKGTEKLRQADVNHFAAIGRNRLTIEGKPGDLLLNKQADAQNLAVGAPFELTVEPGKPGHVDGMVAYCMDLRRHSPDQGQGFDVLGPAGARPEPGMRELQRVLEVGARLQTQPLRFVDGLQDAVWRITDNGSLDDEPEAIQILAAAGVPLDATFATPRFANPNAAAPTTSAVTTDGVVPAPPPSPYLARLRIRPARVRAGTRPRVRLTLTVADAPDAVRIELQRLRRGEWRPVRRLARRTLKPGVTTLRVRLPRLARGRHRVAAIGTVITQTAAIRSNRRR
jgi:hypothetical protein